VLAPLAVAFTVSATPASAAVTLPHSVAVFYHRDFVTLTDYGLADTVTTDVLRNGVLIASAPDVSPTVDPATGEPSILINHPGGICWANLTPDMQRGDVVRTTVTAGPDAGTVESTTTSNVDVTQQAFVDVNNNVVVQGFAADATGAPLPLNQTEQRIIGTASDLFDATGKRTLRAGPNTLAPARHAGV